jgi:hypothetical protein
MTVRRYYSAYCLTILLNSFLSEISHYFDIYLPPFACTTASVYVRDACFRFDVCFIKLKSCSQRHVVPNTDINHCSHFVVRTVFLSSLRGTKYFDKCKRAAGWDLPSYIFFQPIWFLCLISLLLCNTVHTYGGFVWIKYWYEVKIQFQGYITYIWVCEFILYSLFSHKE